MNETPSKKTLDYNDILEVLKQKFEEKWEEPVPPSSEVGLDKLVRLACIGEGAFGKVFVVHNIKSDKYYAMKMISKRHILKENQVEHTLNEKKFLLTIKFPFIVSMDMSFKDNSCIYFVMPFLIGGDMFNVLRKLDKFDEELARFYGAQVVLALEFLHYCKILYRDLKPENILINAKGYIKIADLGFCKKVIGRTWTLCGTPDYIAPEIILSKGYGAAVDWWSFGVLIYEMCAGRPPFSAKDEMKTYERIVKGKYKFPIHFSKEAKDIVYNLLQVDLSRRYGNLKNGVGDIKHHVWFKTINWVRIFYREIDAPYTPKITSPGDISNFDTHNLKGERIASREEFEKEFSKF